MEVLRQYQGEVEKIKHLRKKIAVRSAPPDTRLYIKMRSVAKCHHGASVERDDQCTGETVKESLSLQQAPGVDGACVKLTLPHQRGHNLTLARRCWIR